MIELLKTKTVTRSRRMGKRCSKSSHAHSMSSMWYDTRPQDTEDGKSVIDKQFIVDLLKESLDDGTKVYFGKELEGDELIDAYTRNCKPSVSQSLIGSTIPNLIIIDKYECTRN